MAVNDGTSDGEDAKSSYPKKKARKNNEEQDEIITVNDGVFAASVASQSQSDPNTKRRKRSTGLGAEITPVSVDLPFVLVCLLTDTYSIFNVIYLPAPPCPPSKSVVW